MEKYSLQQKQATVRIPHYSRSHNVIPKHYVQEWKTDMQNRNLIIENCNLSQLPHFEHDDPLFLCKREQLSYNVEDANRVANRYHLPSREEMLHPPNHHSTIRFKGALQSRNSKDVSPPEN